MVDNDDFRKAIAGSPLTDSIVVQAGPGSGKTTLLIERLKYIIRNNKNLLSGICCITYTNAAKDEIITRIQNEGVILPHNMFIGTIHSLLLDYVIKPYSYIGSKLGIPFKLVPFGFTHGYKREIGALLGQPTHSINESILSAFESLGRDEKGNAFCYRKNVSEEAASAWKAHIIQKGYIDHQDVIYLSFRIFKKYEHIRKAFSNRFPYILVDEYQDVTYYQDQFFSLLTSSFFCVGDTNQSIYSFTGAKPEIFQSMWNSDRYKSYTLRNNFRSSNNIVEFANLKSNILQESAGKNANSNQKVLFIKNVKQAPDAIQLFQRIQGEIDCEGKHKAVMILARKNDYINTISNYLKRQEEPLNLFLKKLKKESYRRYKILQNILLAISYKKSNLFEKAIERIEEAFSYLFFNEHPNFVALGEIGYNSFMWKKIQIITLQFLDSLVLTEITVADFFETVKNFLIVESKNLYGKPIGTKIRMLNYNWKNQSRTSKKTIVSDLIIQAELQENVYKVENSVYSIHTAKGLESECILVMAESEDQLNEWLEDNKDSEEARVGYVAFSRARKLLCIWAPSIKEENYTHLKFVEFVDKTYKIKKESVQHYSN